MGGVPVKLHPATQILLWCALVGALQLLAAARLLALGGLVLLLACALSRSKFLQLLRRTRWIMLTLWLIYAYTTPGSALFDALGAYSPSREGLLDGGLQLMRLLAALAALAMLLDRLHRQQLMAGLYTLFAPLQWLGLSRERLAVRLALTLHYAEVAMLLETRGWQAVLGSLSEPAEEVARPIELPVCRFAAGDFLLMSLAALSMWMVMR